MTTPIAQPKVKEDSPFVGWRVDHAAIRVPDFDAAIAWYTEKLELRLKKHVSFAGLTFAFLSASGDNEFVLELLAGPDADSLPPHMRISMRATGWQDGITCAFVLRASTLPSIS